MLLNIKNAKQKIAYFIATSAYIGNAKIAPGTWGSLPGLWVGYLIYQNIPESFTGIFLKILILLLLSYIAFYTIKITEDEILKHDDKSIVIDEVVGQAIVIAFLPPSLLNYVVAFILFRFFDITKLGPIGWADKKLHSSFGTLLDDIFAGIVALGIMLLYQLIW